MTKEENVPQTQEDKQWKKLCFWLKKGNEQEQSKALKKIINIIANECKEISDEQKFNFPDEKFKEVLTIILSKKKDNSQLIEKFYQIANYPDVVFHFWRCLPKVMLKGPQNKIYCLNLLEIIDKMVLPKHSEQPECTQGMQLLFESENDFTWNYGAVKRSINTIWGRTRGWTLSREVHKKLLIVMVEHIMPHLEKSIVWTDFFIESLNTEGSISFLALQGVYNLMVKHNIEVPQIYKKLYNMIQPDVFHSRFKPRLFYLVDLFLSSTHLPESMVASFIKRISRLALIAPPEDICIIIYLVCDLMIRHPGLKKMVDRPMKDETSELNCQEDPFDENESDPMMTRAIESSLWEIRSLERHVLPSVSSIAKYIKQTLPSVQYGIGSKLEDTGATIFNREFRKNFNDVALNFERPKMMALRKDDRIQKYWDLKA